jgi:AraC-like DNA-binding protein
LQPIPLVDPQTIRPILAFRERIGEHLHLPPVSSATNAPFPLAYVGHLFEELAVAASAENVGLIVGAASRFDDLSAGQCAAASPTIGAALALAARVNSRYCGGERLWITQRGGDVWVQRRFPDAVRRGRRQLNDFALQIVIDLVRRGTGPRWRPAELHLEGPAPAHAEEISALATGSTHFGAVAECLVFPRSILALPLPPSPGPARPSPPPLPDPDFVGSVRQTIRFLLELGELNLPNLAEVAGTSSRSLQRHLAASGLGFGRLVDEARFQAASRLLRDPAVRIIDVSAELGYTDSANFTRAFRRWAGVSPFAFRRAAQLECDAGVR